jgi:V/A-type H+/Na+-transporting ATPase subunit B
MKGRRRNGNQSFSENIYKNYPDHQGNLLAECHGVGNEELAMVNGRLAQVVKIMGDNVTLQVFAGTEGIPTNAEVVFFNRPPTLKVSEDLAGRFFNSFGQPIDGGPEVEGEEREIGGPSVNPVRRKQPSELIATGIAGIDLNNTLVTGQKIPFFADPDQPYNQVMAMVALAPKPIRSFLAAWVLPTTITCIIKMYLTMPEPSTASSAL